MQDAAYWIQHLELEPHPEGGFYKQVYRAQESISQNALPSRFSGNRSFATSIYFLLSGNDVSKFHRIKSDELWHFYAGSSLTVYMIDEASEQTQFVLGGDYEAGECFQNVVHAGRWFGAALNKTNSFALIGCTVAPGFDFADFELAEQANLLKQYPQHEQLIKRLT